jgi:hypothetical protein
VPIIFRAKIPDVKSMGEVMDWYNRINTETINYVVQAMPNLDVSDFFRWIIGQLLINHNYRASWSKKMYF